VVRHSETAERKRNDPQNRGVALGKMTNDQQEAGVPLSKGKSILSAFVDTANFSLTKTALVKCVATRAGMVGADGGK
jgi:hypothetical protein